MSTGNYEIHATADEYANEKYRSRKGLLDKMVHLKKEILIRLSKIPQEIFEITFSRLL